MAILIRENRILDGQEFYDLKVFKSDKVPISRDEELKAIDLDEFLSKFFSELREEVQKKKLIDLKGKSGVLELWYFIGEKLGFVDDPKKLEPTDKKYIWKAIWFHAKDLAPGEMKTRAGTNRDHFLYCYKLAQYEKQFVLNAGNWRNWMDFFDSPILSNEIVLEWFADKTKGIKELGIKNWLRDFITKVRNTFQNIDMSFLSKDEIINKMDKIFDSFVRNSQNPK